MSLSVHWLPNGLPLRYRKPSDEYIVKESGKKAPPYLRHGDIEPTDTMLDIGAQIGIISLLSSTLVAHVHSFEPEPANWEMLQKNTAKIENITSYNKFVCGNSHKGPVSFYIANKNLSAHSAYIKRGRKEIKVATIPIGEILQKTKPQVVKLDCEGAEYEILLDGLLDHKNIEVITFEAHFGRKEWHDDYQKILKLLRISKYTMEAKESSKGWPSFVHASKRL